MFKLMVASSMFFFILLTGCMETPSKVRISKHSNFTSNQEITLDELKKSIVIGSGNSKTHNGITYSFQMMSATEFLTKKGENVETADRAELDNETVMIVTFNSTKKLKDIFELEQMTLNKEDAVQYLIGELGNDVTIEQDNETIKAKGVHYESSFGEIGQLRAFLFFDRIGSSTPAKVVYYDRLFGAGLLKFEIKK